jgi:phosphatidylserine synthase
MEMKLKDWVTMGNLLCGMGSGAVLMFPGMSPDLSHADRVFYLHIASYLVVAGFLFDASDGLVARLTKQFNLFGGELDNLCDMVTYSIAPGFLLYYAFAQIAGWPLWASGLVAFFPVAVGTVRAARYNVRRASFPGFFVGLPRTAFAFVMVALLNSVIFHNAEEMFGGRWAYAIPAVVVAYISYLMVSYKPFISHHGHRWTGLILFGLVWFLVSIPAGVLIGWLAFDAPEFVFDILLFDLMVYLFLGTFTIPKTMKTEYWAYIEKWKTQGE